MKKTYISPKMEVFKIGKTVILAGSGTVPATIINDDYNLDDDVEGL